MQKLFASILFALALSISAFAQSPSMVIQNAASFTNQSPPDSSPSVIAHQTIASLYPTVSNFNISGTGSADPPASQITTSGGDTIRVLIRRLPGLEGPTQVCRVSYVSASQINLVFDTEGTAPPPFAVDAMVQKWNGSSWDTDRTLFSLAWVNVNPHIFVATGGANQADADLYAFDGVSGYFFLKKVLDGDPNPRSYNGRPTVVSLYLTGAKKAILSGGFCGDLKLGGSSWTPVGGFADSSYVGVQQLNFEVPSTMSGSTTIQVGGRLNDGGACVLSSNVFGNTATIPNWQ